VNFPSAAAQLVIDIGAPSWCWSHLGAAGEGILSYQSPRGRSSLAVPYTVTGQQISMPLACFNSAGWSAAGAEVCLEISGLTPDGLRWVVRASGVAERDDQTWSPGLAYARRVHPAAKNDRTPTTAMDQLVLAAPRIRGFYETPLTT
jgi:hypothetical protein